MFYSFRRVGLLAAALLVVVSTACGTEQVSAPAILTAPTAIEGEPDSRRPVPAPADRDLLGGLLGTVTGTVGAVTNALGLTSASGVLRDTPLPEDITVRKTIGWMGGSLSIPAAGVTVYIPAGALARDTEITMTARAGRLLAYDFAPHGITFARPLVLNQSLHGTNVGLLSPLSLKLGYYKDPSQLGETTALVSELIGGLTNVLSRTFTAPIKHFSGYVIVCGRSDDE